MSATSWNTVPLSKFLTPLNKSMAVANDYGSSEVRPTRIRLRQRHPYSALQPLTTMSLQSTSNARAFQRQ